MDEFEPDSRPLKRKHESISGIPCTPLAMVVSALIGCVGVVIVAVIGAIPVGSKQQPLACSFDAGFFQGVYVCQGNVDNSDVSIGTNSSPTPTPDTATQVVMTLTAIAQQATSTPLSATQTSIPNNTVTASNTPSPTPLFTSTSTYTVTPTATSTSTSTPSLTQTSTPTDTATFTPLPSNTFAPTRTSQLSSIPETTRLSCTTPIPPAANNNRIEYTAYYSDLYQMCGWEVVWQTLASQKTVSGSPPTQRSMQCYGTGYEQYDEYSCITSYGIDTFILQASSTVSINDPHCISYAPNISNTTSTSTSDTKTASGSDGVSIITTNLSVKGEFTLFLWCVVNWEQ